MAGIRAIGSTIVTDADGFLRSAAPERPIPAPWDEAVRGVVEDVRSHFGSRLHSVYVRGSVACGTPIAGVSDLDMFVVLGDCATADDTAWLDDHSIRSAARYPFATKLDVVALSLAQVRDGREIATRFLLKVLSVCVSGEDLRGSLPPVRPGPATAISIGTLDRSLEEVREILRSAPEPGDVRDECVWIAKQILRSGMELVAEREQAFSRDLHPCYELFAGRYPEQAARMRRVLELAIEPASDPDDVLDAIDGIGVWLVAEAAALNTTGEPRQPRQAPAEPVPEA